ncbi:MAG TPA: peptidylprolyl isomerase [Trueperaceae bacterium]|nr:peptidylprolyl isomerase [Trueperaceae bacterium]
MKKTRERPLARAGLLALLAALLVAIPASAQEPAPVPPAEEQPAPAQEAVPPRSDADPVLIRLGGTVERLSDVAWRFEVAMRSFAAGQGIPYTDDIAVQLRGLMPQYIEQRGTELVLLREAAQRSLVPDETAVQETLDRLRASVAAEDYETALTEAGFPSEEALVTLIREADLIGQVVNAIREESQPTDQEVRVRYLADIARYTQPETYCARHILVAEEALAQELVDRVRGGEDFATLAGEHGTDGTARTGGDLGCFQRGMMVAPFEEAVLAAEVGAVSGPVQTQFGYHALLVYEHRPASVLPFEEVRDAVAESAAADAAFAAMEGLMRGSGLVTYPERVPAPAAPAE